MKMWSSLGTRERPLGILRSFYFFSYVINGVDNLNTLGTRLDVLVASPCWQPGA